MCTTVLFICRDCLWVYSTLSGSKLIRLAERESEEGVFHMNNTVFPIALLTNHLEECLWDTQWVLNSTYGLFQTLMSVKQVKCTKIENNCKMRGWFASTIKSTQRVLCSRHMIFPLVLSVSHASHSSRGTLCFDQQPCHDL